jgi:hypothetical protein
VNNEELIVSSNKRCDNYAKLGRFGKHGKLSLLCKGSGAITTGADK